jgi:hypothetical protein
VGCVRGWLLVHESELCELYARRLGKEPTVWRSSTLPKKRETYRERLSKWTKAPAPARPVDVMDTGGAQWRWTCAGCHRLHRGEPARRVGNRWYCK